MSRAEVYDGVTAWLRGEKLLTDYHMIDYDLLGVSIKCGRDMDWIATVPGALALVLRRPGQTAVLCLDFAFDLTDEEVQTLREPVLTAFLDTGTPFLPVSIVAASAGIGASWSDLQLVDRDGLQCVFLAKDNCYISGFDANEDPPLYFMARLPHPVTSYREAIEALKPPSVKLAEARGVAVLRQGDLFAIQTEYRTADLTAMGAVFDTTRQETVQEVEWDDTRPGLLKKVTRTRTRRRGLYGTAHTATKLATLPDGTMFARGLIIHDPRGVRGERRMPDHHDLVLCPPGWYLVAKNTVPVVK